MSQDEQSPATATGTPGSVYASTDVAQAWRAAQGARGESLGPATELMLDVAGVRAGSRVLDIGAGTGEESLMAARRVGPTGRVLTTDLNTSMLDLAAEAVGRAGLGNIETRVMDAQRIELEPAAFEAVISRLTISLLPERHAALAGILRVLVPGGRFAAMVYAAPERNPLSFIPLTIAKRRGLHPGVARDRPGMFALGFPGAFEDALRTAGFAEVAVHAVAAPRRYPSLAEAVGFLRASPLLRRETARLADADRESLWAEIEDALRQFGGAHGFEAPGEVLVGAGTRP